MIRYRRALMIIGLVVVATGASPLFRDILDIPKLFYTCAFEHSGHIFLSAFNLVEQVLQGLSLQFVALLVFVLYCLNRLWNLLFSPLDYVRYLGDTGYLKQNLSKRDTANEVRRRKKIGDVPPVYPNGWFLVLHSAELAVKDVKYVSILGEHLAVFRGEDGVVYILDAYCPHLGANIAVGGQVQGNCIQCPFHGWRFQGDSGACVEIPYCKSPVPEFAKTRSWNTLEKNDRIYVWYHAEGAEPDWVPEDIEEVKNGKWSFAGQTLHYINSHIQDLPENGSDMNHLNILHTPFISCGRNLQHVFTSFWNFGYHEWIASWQPLDKDEKHCSILTVTQKAHIFGYHISILDMHVKAKQIGPGIVYMRWHSKLGSGVFTHEVTPVEPLLQRLSQTVYTGFPIPKILAKILLYCEAIQLERDVMVWNYKTYVSKPLLMKEDQALKKHRQWFQQFYSENSPRLHLANNNNLEW